LVGIISAGVVVIVGSIGWNGVLVGSLPCVLYGVGDGSGGSDSRLHPEIRMMIIKMSPTLVFIFFTSTSKYV
jgi:hypothetical protein